jgi:drug/metabolite transporter (DMT)-like permease
MLKFAGHHRLRELHVYLVNYLVAGIAAFMLSDMPISTLFKAESIGELGFGVFVGLLYMSNLILMGRSMNENGIGLTVSVMRISLVIPVIVSILVFSEQTSTLRVIGLVLAFAALGVLFKPSKVERSSSALYYLLVIFLLTGIGDVSLKVFQASGSPIFDKWLFMGVVFTTCTILCLGYILFREKPVPTTEEFKVGVLVGVPNLTASIFILMGLELVPASVAFPTSNLTIITTGTILGKLYWKDALTRRHYVVILLAIAAIVLLTMDI